MRLEIFLTTCLLLAGLAASSYSQGLSPRKKTATIKLDSTPIVYEVSKSSRDQKKLMKVFTTVRDRIDPTLTRDEFVRRLKAREHFEIRYPVQCRTCNGWKRLIPVRGKRGKDGKINCNTCYGRGFEMRPHLVKWSAARVTHEGDQRDPYLSSLKRELGDKASAQVWYTISRSYELGERKNDPEARALAHAGYHETIKLANLAWRDKEPVDSDMNRLHRRLINQSLKGIAATAAKREPKKKPPSQQPGRKTPIPRRSD
ncbi:MAG: hypothetical protein ACI8XO_002087 [Verrucomicrobiales bacterium]|jgi:hypothetical protein